ncbi:MAG: SDR family oxidoreductase [Bacteroidia bacterium]|nr:SDR family oxidoreductase [Bacteroidia bacterium]
MEEVVDLTHKVVIITGASSGIGEASAYAFAARKCRLVLAARNREKLNDVAAKCKLAGAETLVVSCDVSKEEECNTLIQSAIGQFGTIHVLINNAGISMRALFDQAGISVIKQVMDINFWGTVYCTHAAMPYLLKEQGSVVGVSSIAGIKGLPGRTGYSASKFAMNGFMEALRIENLHKGLHVGVICPGYTASNIRNTALNKDGKSQAESPFDESKLMPAEAVAEEIVSMVVRRREERILTLQGKLTFWLNKFLPRWVDSLVYKTVSKEKDSPFK